MANSCYVTFQKSFKTCFHVWDCIHTASSVCTCIRERVPNASSKQTDEAHFRQPLFHRKWDPLTFAIQSVWKCIAWNRSTPPCPDMHSPPPLCPLSWFLLPPYIFLFLSNRQPSVPAHSQLLVPSPYDQIIDPTELMLYFMQRSTPASLCIWPDLQSLQCSHKTSPQRLWEHNLIWPKHLFVLVKIYAKYRLGWLQFHCNMYFKGQENIFNLKM